MEAKSVRTAAIAEKDTPFLEKVMNKAGLSDLYRCTRHYRSGISDDARHDDQRSRGACL
jgi:hypothetical protein